MRIQSMINIGTMDTAAVITQAGALFRKGCEMVRVSVRNMKEADQLAVIRSGMEEAGIRMPLVADIHFNPKLAERAAALVHKVRINPGNYFDQQYFLAREQKQRPEQMGLREREEGIARLIGICREHGTVIRVGVNHGSLSERIMERYGNTVEGMVASAMEFLEVCSDLGFHDLVVSMKSSHVPTMVSATRAIAASMMLKGMDYPIHLGVTEAGAGDDGRIRSAAGIGPLLAEGLGDTIRVSLTEDPVKEIPVAKKLVSMFAEERMMGKPLLSHPAKGKYNSRLTEAQGIVGGDNPPAVVGEDNTSRSGQLPDLRPAAENILEDVEGRRYPVYEPPDGDALTGWLAGRDALSSLPLLLLSAKSGNLPGILNMFAELEKHGSRMPVLVRFDYDEKDEDALLLRCATDLSVMILRGYGNAFWLVNGEGALRPLHEYVFALLQATGARITGTEYISCPSCGRTSYNIERALELIRQHTAGLVNVRIAVMGCIVNGPGEMAEADYGYVGAGKGKISLYYRGKVFKKNIPEDDALGELLRLIKNTQHPIGGR